MRGPVKGRKLKDDEAYCMRCAQAVKMTNVSAKAMQGKLILIRGTCPNCGCTINRGGRLPTYAINKTSAKEINHAE
jgi:ribosomal protein S27AE